MKDAFFVSRDTYNMCLPIIVELDKALKSFDLREATVLKGKLREIVQPLAQAVVTIADEVFSDLQSNVPTKPAGSHLHQTHLSYRKTQTLMKVLKGIRHDAAATLFNNYDLHRDSRPALILLAR